MGINSQTSQSSPVEIINPLFTWDEVSPGKTHTCAITTGKRAFCWGNNSSGELGTGNFTNSLYPVEVSGNYTDWESISSGDSFSCGIRNGGNLYCWGKNSSGQLGIGSLTGSTTPIHVTNNFSWLQISAGNNSSALGITSIGGKAWGFGNNIHNKLGPHLPAPSSIPNPTRVFDD